MKASIRSIAKQAGVSTATVSRVLNNAEGVSQETIQHVRQVLDEHGYLPSVTTREQNTIGVVVKGYEQMSQSQYITLLLAGMIESALQSRHDIKFLTYDSLRQRGLNYLTEMRMKNVSGLVFLGTHLEPAILDELERSDCAALVVGNRCEGFANISWIDVDHEQQVKTALTHLYSLGHRSIACAGFDSETPGQTLRLKVFRSFTDELAGLVRPAPVELARGTTWQDGFALVHAMAARGVLPSALVCTHETLSLGVAAGIQGLGLSVPGDVSVLALGQSAVFEHSHPPLTSVEADITALGARAIQGLLSRMSGERRLVQDVVPATLRQRSSTAAPRR